MTRKKEAIMTSIRPISVRITIATVLAAAAALTGAAAATHHAAAASHGPVIAAAAQRYGLVDCCE
jgi:hypothetical protein